MTTVIRSKEYFICKYGEEEGTRRANRAERIRNLHERNRKIVFDKDNPETSIEEGNAIRCNACGAVMSRLQWRHFKYKCSVNSIAEYKNNYPGAPLVAPNLVKMLGVTFENMVAAHGEEEGKKKYDNYCAKQAETNTFEYKAKKFGMSKNEFDTYNASRAVTIENLIANHGEDEGIAIWENYREQQRYTTTVEYFIEKYGEIDGAKRYESFCRGRNFNGGSSITSTVENAFYKSLQEHIEIDQQIDLGSAYFRPFDFGSYENKKLIEFYGSYWHADPKTFKETDRHPTTHQTAKMIWSRDRVKRTFALNSGYDIFVIWENDYYADPDGVLAKVIEWWNNDRRLNEGNTRTGC